MCTATLHSDDLTVVYLSGGYRIVCSPVHQFMDLLVQNLVVS